MAAAWKVNLGLSTWALLFCGLTLASDPIKPSPKLPDTTPWNLATLSEPPQLEWLNVEGPVRSLLYRGEDYRGKPTRVFAYYATPGSLASNSALDKNLPAMVLIHGGGGTAFREWVELWAQRGYAAIAMDLAGSRPMEGKNAHRPENRVRLEDGGPAQGDDEKFGNIDQPVEGQWPYHAVAAVLRAHSLIRSFPEVDRQRTAVTGISWGGYLTCIVAGLDSRFRAAVPVYGCGFLQENSAWLDRFAKMTPEQKDRWVALWDPSRYLPAVTMPILFVNGTNDFAYPLDSYMKSFQLVPGNKQLCVTVNMPHGHPQGWAPIEIGLFVDQVLKSGTALPALESPVVQDGKATVKYQSATKLKSAALHYTTQSNPINQREWMSPAAEIVDGQIATPVLPQEATAWFVTVTDERGAVVSSEIQFK